MEKAAKMTVTAYALAIAFAISVTLPCSVRAEDGLASNPTPTTTPAPVKATSRLPERITVALQAGTNGSTVATEIDINASYLLTNIGIVARNWSSQEDSDASRRDIGLFMGVGLIDVLQVQAGYLTTTGFKLRLRSDLPLALTEDAWNRFQRKGQYWVITPSIEIPLAPHHGVFYGVGLGYAF